MNATTAPARFAPGFLILAAGLLGAAGVAGAALAAHGGEERLTGIAAAILLVHAPALLALAALALTRPRVAALCGALLTLGAGLFAGDLLARVLLGARLFESAAPAGGLILILGWLLVAFSGILSLFNTRAV